MHKASENIHNKKCEINEEYNEIFLLASKISFDGIWDWNILTNDFFLGEGFEKLFGHSFRNKKNTRFDWTNYLHPDDKETVKKGLKDAIASTDIYWEDGYRFVRPDGSVANVFGRANIIRDSDGKACRMIGAIHDFSRQMELEEKMLKQTRFNEKQIAEAANDAKETERSDIGKELHDNVNQLLAASRMYLEIGKKGGKNSKLYLSRSSEYTLTAIEEIRKLTRGLTTDIIKNLGLCAAIENVARDIMEVNPLKISCLLESFTEHTAHDRFKLNIYRIVQEQLNNILKHAKATKASISLMQKEESIILTIADNGEGFDTGKNQEGIGIDNIKSRAISYSGTADFVSMPGQGCVLNVTFPVTDGLLNES